MGVFLFVFAVFVVIVGGCTWLGRSIGGMISPDSDNEKYSDSGTIHNHTHHHHHNTITQQHLHISKEDLRDGIDPKKG